MVESLLGKTTCHDECQWEHDCWGVYLDSIPLCNNEILRIETALKETPGITHAMFAPKNIVGLRFMYRREGGDSKYLILDDGEVNRLTNQNYSS